MAGTKINNYDQTHSNILELQLTSDQNFKGKHLVSLTNYDTTAQPSIAAGSNIEINGGFYKFASEEAISTTDPHTSATVANTTVYIMINPATVTAYFTATAPTWSDSKQGWYGLTTWANWRYAEFVMTKATAVYSSKRTFAGRENIPNDTFMVGATITKKSYVKAYPGSSQNITGATSTLIIFDTETYDTNSEFASSRFTAKRAGYYIINVNIRENISSNSASHNVAILLNGSDYGQVGSQIQTPTTGSIRRNGSALIYLSVGNYIEIYKSQAAADSSTIIASSNGTFIEILEM